MSLGQEPVQAGDPDVVQPFDIVTHEFGGAGGFFGHRQVGRARGHHQHGAVARLDVLLFEGDQARHGQIHRLWDEGFHGFVGVERRTGDEQCGAAPHDLAGDGGHLGRRLAETEDNLGEPLPHRAVMVDLGKPQIFEGAFTESVEQLALGLGGIDQTGRDRVEQGFQL